MSSNKFISFIHRAIFLKICALVVVTYVLYAVVISLFSINYEVNSILELFVISVKDFFQILFIIVGATIGVLSYIRAKETLFMPIKTETFKMQIKAFEDILLFFQNKGEIELIETFDFNRILIINSHNMLNDYVSLFFKEELYIDEVAVKSLKNDVAGIIATYSYAEKNFIKRQKNNDKIEILNPALILHNWKSYQCERIEYTFKYEEAIDKLRILKATPLIPSDLKNKIKEFEINVRKNLSIVGSIITKISQELPDKYTDVSSIIHFDFKTMWNRYNREKIDLEPGSLEILNYIKSYLKIEELIK